MTYYCGECRKECTVHEEDCGIGPYEYWGQKCNDVNMQLTSDCCDGEVFDDEECTVEASWGDWYEAQEAAHGDAQYDEQVERRLWERRHGDE
jgi:hypothetical protein